MYHGGGIEREAEASEGRPSANFYSPYLISVT